jgi:uncharacterized protein (DUF58 family)
MDTQELIKKVRKIEIKTRGVSNHIFSGEYHSAFKGRGMSFSEVREYQYGDDIRNIDWNVTARFNTPFIKVFEEERELTVILMIDISKSSMLGTISQTKEQIIAEISAVIAFSAINNNDKVGAILFSDKVEKYIPPKKGKSHILRIIREILEHEAVSGKTDLKVALEYFNGVMKKRTISFVLSDFLVSGYRDALNIAAKKHDVIGIRIFDNLDEELPDIGLLQVRDIETNKISWIDTSNKEVRNSYNLFATSNREYFHDSFIKSGADFMEINTEKPYVKELMRFFKSRT